MAVIRPLPPESPEDCGCDCETWGHEDCLGKDKKEGTGSVRLETFAYGVVEIALCPTCSQAIGEHLSRRS